MSVFRGTEIFLAIIDAGSFRAASKATGISKSVISSEIAMLEERLSVKLLNRNNRTMSLTEAGEKLETRLRPLVLGMQDAVAEAIEAQNTPAGVLDISVPQGFGLAQMSPWLVEFKARFPSLEIEVDYSATVRDIVGGGYDLAIRVIEPSDSSLINRQIAPNTMTCCASYDYLDKVGTPETPKDLQGHTCLRLRDGAKWPYWDEWNNSLPEGMRFSTLTSSLTLNNMIAVRDATLLGAGIALLPDYIVADDIIKGRLKPILTEWPVVHGTINCMFPDRRMLPLKTRAFLDFIVEKTTPIPPWDWRSVTKNPSSIVR